MACWKLDEWQRSVVERITSTCRDQQFGFLLYHQVGSGKTISLIGILRNFGSIKKTIFCPAVLRDGYGKDSDDVVNTMDAPSAAAFIDSVDVHPLQTDTKEASFESMVLGDPDGLERLCKDRVVAFDEAHNVVAFIRTLPPEKRSVAYQTIQAALQTARRVIFMTGTPILRNVSDVTLLLSLLVREGRSSPFPVIDDRFSERYTRRTEADAADLRSKQVHIIGRNTAKLVVGGLISTTTALLAQSIAPAPVQAVATAAAGMGAMEWLRSTGMDAIQNLANNKAQAGITTAASLAGGLATQSFTDSYITPVIQGLKQDLQTTPFLSLDPDMFARDCMRYISFFDYESFTGKTTNPRLRFPSVTSKPLVARFPYDEHQLTMLLRMSVRATGVFTAGDRAALGMQALESHVDPDVYLRYICRLSDVSPDSGRVAIDSMPRAVPRCAGAGQCAFRAAGSIGRRVVFRCPKFDLAHDIIEHYATKTTHYESGDVKHCYKVSTEDGGLVVEGGKLVHDPDHRYIPIVYPRFERTMKEFSAYLTSRGTNHVVVTRKSKPAERYLATRRNRLKTGLKHNTGKGKNAIVCAILHPDLIEGLNCTLNPALICLDTIDGYGILQQIHGRILRKVRYSPSTALPETRLPKRIIHMRPFHQPGENYWRDARREYEERVSSEILPGAARRWMPSAVNRVLVQPQQADFKQTLLRQGVTESPESIVDASNDEQRRVIDGITAMFRGQTDETIGRAYCGPPGGSRSYCVPLAGCSASTDGAASCGRAPLVGLHATAEAS